MIIGTLIPGVTISHKARHTDTRGYHLCDLCKEGIMVLEKEETTQQVADLFTKATPKASIRHPY
jgi:hypothetical protein